MARKDLPSPNAPNFLLRVREEVHALLGKLGSSTDRALTLRDAIESGVIVPGPGGSLIPGPGAGGAYDPDLTPPPQPGAFTATGAISHFLISQAQPFYTQGHGHSRTVVYGAQWVSGPLPVFADAVELDRFGGTVRAVASNPATTWHLWIKWESVDGVLSATPSGGTNGVAVTTGQDVALLLDALAGQITSTELASSLSTPIGQIPGIASGLAQEILDRAQDVADEATNRAAAIQASSDAAAASLATEIGNRVAAIQQLDTDLRDELATADATVVSSLTSAYQSADAATLASANSYTFSKTEINTAISAMGTQLTTNFSAADAAALATAQKFTYSRSAIDAADAATLSTLRSEFAAADSSTLATAQNFTYSRATIDGAIASSASTLRSQLTGGSTATDLNLLSSGLLYQMRETSAAQDAALSQQITLLSAGAGEQFDYSNIWYFDSGVESWTTNGTDSTLSAVSGWLRLVSNSGALTDRYFISPDNLGVNGAKYPQARLRVRKVGNPTWEGALYFITTTDATYNGAKSATIAQPSYDANGIGLVTFNMPASWTGATIRQIRFDASTTITPTDYFELDWVAVGRPSPGASSAQLTAEQVARVDGDNANAQNIIALNAALAGKADASALNALETRVTSAEGVNTSQGSSITSLQNSVTTINSALGTKADASALAELTTRVTAAEGVNTSQGSSITSLNNSLTTTNTNVTAAQTAATNAATLAGSKGKVMVQSAAPAAGDQLTQNLWIDTTGGANTPKRWNSSAWVAVTDKVATDAAAAAAAAQATANTKADASAVSALTTRVTTAENTISSQGSSITSLQNDLSTLTGAVGTKASASALNALDARVTSAEGVNSSQATAITGLQASVTSLGDGLATKADASALTTTNTNVSNLAGTVSAQAGQITTLQSQVIGGVNLAKNSDKATGFPSLGPGVTVTEVSGQVLPDGTTGTVVRLQNVSGAAVRVPNCIVGTGKYSFGFWHKLIAGSGSITIDISDVGAGSWATSATWQKLVREDFNATQYSAAVYHFMDINIPVGMTLDIYQFKVEQGSKLTGWSPSHKDFTAALQVEATTRATQTGELYAQYTVKTDVGGLVSGYGLASSAVNAAPTSAFGVQAGQFFVAPPAVAAATAPTAGLFKGYAWRDTTANVTKYWTGSAWSTSPQALPFVVQAVPQTINGFTVEAGIYADSAFFARLVATRGQIGLLAVDDARIADLSVSKLTAGSIAVGQFAQSTGYVAGSAGWRINGDGNAEFSNAIVRGIVYASGGEFTGTVRGATIIGGTLTTAESGQRVKIDEQGILFLTGASNGKYGGFKYGSKKYGDGVLVYFNNTIKRVPFYVASEQNVADIHLYNRSADPPPGESGDLICVNSRIKTWDSFTARWRSLAFSD